MKASDLFIKMMAIAGSEYIRIADFHVILFPLRKNTNKYEQMILFYIGTYMIREHICILTWIK